MPAIEQPRIAQLVRETRQRLKLTQVKLAMILGVCFHTINRWENRHTQPSPLAMKQIAELLQQMGEPGESLLAKYF
ncbi:MULTISPECIES: helix-turn-helix transcriptional regulator [unclassified Nostoc]|uniref:XRE family transcriptional regulator n=1 Tax=Nostoc punctiforme NIES-2108 TaxID=1356359 RepID=A0A367RPE7_NOSPU|nr:MULTISPECIES: helix-turn-helix transcriptional regulator [unclassified Nostoc]MBN3877435.1 helix-turn-helix transcriptional regulator [Nostoc sp. JL23]MBN3893545.1 helix-turn-helix transcriptional regulator [Nostoc sp. JL31]RCJ37731.1 XRE family transcriptional regulator [Nostoc punctiforme NIES-2108]